MMTLEAVRWALKQRYETEYAKFCVPVVEDLLNKFKVFMQGKETAATMSETNCALLYYLTDVQEFFDSLPVPP